MAEVKYKAGSPAAVMTTELDGLANNARAISGAVDNTADLDFWDDVELVVTYGTAPSAGGTVELYLVESVDGTNYGDGGSGVAPPATTLVGVFPLRAVTTAQRIMVRGVMIPPLNFKYVAVNKAGQATAASGNTLKRLPYKVQSV
jgi:hypothetical protein